MAGSVRPGRRPTGSGRAGRSKGAGGSRGMAKSSASRPSKVLATTIARPRSMNSPSASKRPSRAEPVERRLRDGQGRRRGASRVGLVDPVDRAERQSPVVVADLAQVEMAGVVDRDVFPIDVGHRDGVLADELPLASHGEEGGGIARVIVGPENPRKPSALDDPRGFSDRGMREPADRLEPPRRRLPDRQRQSDQSDHVHGPESPGTMSGRHRITFAADSAPRRCAAPRNENGHGAEVGAVAEVRSVATKPSLDSEPPRRLWKRGDPARSHAVGRGRESRRDRGIGVVEEAEDQPHGGIRVVRRAGRRIDVSRSRRRAVRVWCVMGVQLGRA